MGSVLKFGSLLLAASLPAFASPLLEDRGTCGRDNLLRCFDPTGTASKDIASRSAATAFCSSYLSIPVVTSTIATTTPVSTVTSTLSLTDATVTLTSTSTSVLIQSTTTVVATITNTVAPQPLPKRDEVATIAPPACVNKEYAPASLSSACSCLNIAPSTTSVTATASTSTSVSVSVVYETASTTTVTTTTTTTSAITSATATSSCIEGQVTASDGRVFQAECNAAVSMNGYFPIVNMNGEVPDLASCIDQCLTTYASRGCIAVNYRIAYFYLSFLDTYYNYCEIISSFSGVQYDQANVDTIYLIS